jgi:spermidine synthase
MMTRSDDGPARPDERTCGAHSTLGFRHPTWGIFLVSVLGLFLEMLLIRWIGTEIRIFAYLQNTVLVVCFLGLGMGCFTCRQPIRLRRLLLPLAVLTSLLAVPVFSQAVHGISDDLSVLSDLVIWKYETASADAWQAVAHVARGLLLTGLLMVLLWEMFVPVGRLLGRLLDDHPRIIQAYSVNVAGSLVGIWLFVLISALYLPPVVWMLCFAGLLAFFLDRGPALKMNVALLALCALGAWLAGREPGSWEVAWSPYQKLVLAPIAKADHTGSGDYGITVNNVGYQAMVDLSSKAAANDPSIADELRGLSQYDIPLLLKPQPRDVLIVGAGSGNDAAGALRGGAQRVTAVDIDPAIIDMGRRYHPEHPYASPKVRVVNDDARSFFAVTTDKYDLIIFGLLDSHTTTAMTNARLDHYVYTRESLARARSLLTDDGVLVLTFMVQEPFIADRIARALREVFGRPPLVFARRTSRLGWGGVTFVAGNERVIHANLQANPRLDEQIALWQSESPVDLPGTTPVATDDWPYLYLAGPQIPTLYFLLAGLLAALYFYGQKRLGLSRLAIGWGTSHWHFFFLGAAFLLLEVQNISKASVVLGNTWLVNAVVISGILLMILLSNLIAARVPKLPPLAAPVCLVASCLVLYFVDLSQFAFLPYPTKALLVGVLTALPMLFSGILFIQSFARVERKDLALGANLLGSLVGAVLQSITFVVGIKALLLIVAGFYLAAIFTRPAAQPIDETPAEPATAAVDEDELALAAH